MRKGIVVFLVLGVLVGCYRTWIEVTEEVQAPNWTSDNKVIFLLERIEWYHEEAPPVFSGYVEPRRATLILMQCNADGSGMESLGVVYDVPEKDYTSLSLGLSSAGDWVVVSVKQEIWVIRRDGTGLQKVGSGINPDFSPDASQIVYEKPDSGIWIMDRDGSNNHCIVPDPDAKYPAWSPDDTLVAYGWVTHIVNLKDNSIKEYPHMGFLDWGPKGSGAFLAWYDIHPVIVDLKGNVRDTLISELNGAVFWSPDGQYFIGLNGSWWVCKKDGTNKWYINSKIKGGE